MNVRPRSLASRSEVAGDTPGGDRGVLLRPRPGGLLGRRDGAAGGHEAPATGRPWGAPRAAGRPRGFLTDSRCARAAPGCGDPALGVSDVTCEDVRPYAGTATAPLCLCLVLLSVSLPVSVCLPLRPSLRLHLCLSLGLRACGKGQARPAGQQTDIASMPDGGGAFGFSTTLCLSLKKNLLSKGPQLCLPFGHRRPSAAGLRAAGAVALLPGGRTLVQAPRAAKRPVPEQSPHGRGLRPPGAQSRGARQAGTRPS